LRRIWDSDRDPLVALRDGDPGLFEALVTEESATFLAFFRRLGAPRSEAEDLVQEVFLKLFRHAHTYQPTGKFQAFAFRIARNAWIDRQRRLAVRPPSWGSGRFAAGEEIEGEPEREFASDAPSPEALAEREEEAGRVSEAMARLPETHRLVFELGVVQELPYSEISRMLEIPEGTVKSRMFHAVRKLREVLEDLTAGEERG
jgi:RNA polymerase sigma-70 factor, ECF subfamily